MRKATLRILLALLAPAALALAETTDYSDESGIFTVKLPAEWTVEVHHGPEEGRRT